MEKTVEDWLRVGCCVNQNIAEKHQAEGAYENHRTLPALISVLKEGGGRQPRAGVTNSTQGKRRQQHPILA